ncbi:ribose 5-phosphate isomerase A [Plasmodium falciparum FCH/4]|uniref:ribose-5-phosphate isomerase n=1 Tax=Plasmodium falciparum FCH/4 TaxID=1036724 RepID=A0A024VTX5_PLAFA|nr:ribose 5-phosphate isomerase A [Plasmodium falciparum FCH/4]
MYLFKNAKDSLINSLQYDKSSPLIKLNYLFKVILRFTFLVSFSFLAIIVSTLYVENNIINKKLLQSFEITSLILSLLSFIILIRQNGTYILSKIKMYPFSFKDLIDVSLSTGVVTISILDIFLARKLGIPLTTLEKHSNIDITIDGTDEIDLNLNLIKGRGGALVREKLVASSSSLFIIIGDESKLCTNGLGMTGAVPIEILTFGYEKIIENLLKIYTLKGCTYKIRKRNGEIFITDNKNYIVDFFFTEPIQDLLETCTRIKMVTRKHEQIFYFE